MQHLLNKLPSPILITGPAFSGKSDIAQQVMGPLEPVSFIGTCIADSAILRQRIRELQTKRPGGWRTIETADDIAPLLESIAKDGQHLLLDSFSLWLASRLIGHASRLPLEEEQVLTHINAEVTEMIGVLAKFSNQRLVIVSAESGSGPSPRRATERLLRMLIGTSNCHLASMCRTVIEVKCGIPTIIKES